MDERTGARYSLDHPNKLPGYILAAPEKAPARFTDRRQLSGIVNEIERSEMLDNSVLGHYWMVIANRQHSEFDHFAVVMQVANEIVKRYRVLVVASIDKAGDGQTLQYHFGCNMRRIDANGIGRKVKQINLMAFWPRERTWFSRAVAAATIQHHGIIPREEENYEF